MMEDLMQMFAQKIQKSLTSLWIVKSMMEEGIKHNKTSQTTNIKFKLFIDAAVWEMESDINNMEAGSCWCGKGELFGVEKSSGSDKKPSPKSEQRKELKASVICSNPSREQVCHY